MFGRLFHVQCVLCESLEINIAINFMKQVTRRVSIKVITTHVLFMISRNLRHSPFAKGADRPESLLDKSNVDICSCVLGNFDTLCGHLVVKIKMLRIRMNNKRKY
jgi:hypothetical protein